MQTESDIPLKDQTSTSNITYTPFIVTHADKSAQYPECQFSWHKSSTFTQTVTDDNLGDHTTTAVITEHDDEYNPSCHSFTSCSGALDELFNPTGNDDMVGCFFGDEDFRALKAVSNKVSKNALDLYSMHHHKEEEVTEMEGDTVHTESEGDSIDDERQDTIRRHRLAEIYKLSDDMIRRCPLQVASDPEDCIEWVYNALADHLDSEVFEDEAELWSWMQSMRPRVSCRQQARDQELIPQR